MNFEKLNDFLDYYLPMVGVIGSDTVIYKNHEPIYRYSSGYDNYLLKTPVKRDAFYNIYSCSKVLAGVLTMQLIERGEILANDPVYAYFPEYKDLKVKVKDENGNVIGYKKAENTMLIRHLLTMTSGLNYDLRRPAVQRVIAETDGRAPTLDVCRAIAEDGLEFNPGERYQYGLSLDVIGGIVELVSGMPLGEYVRENVFEPLGMYETAFHPDFSKRDRFATQYTLNSETGGPEIVPFELNQFRFGPEYDSLGAGIFTTVDDYILLLDALANRGVGKTGARIISSRSIDVIRTNLLTEKQRHDAFDGNQCEGFGYGYGVRCVMEKATVGNLATVGSFGWDGWKTCFAHMDVENNIAVFHAEHMENSHSVILPRLRNVIFSCLDD